MAGEYDALLAEPPKSEYDALLAEPAKEPAPTATAEEPSAVRPSFGMPLAKFIDRLSAPVVRALGEKPGVLQDLLGASTREIKPSDYPIPEVPQQEGTAAQVGAAVVNAPIRLANFVTSPEGVALGGGLGIAPKALRVAAGLGFTGLETKAAIQAPTLQERLGHIIGATAIGAGTGIDALTGRATPEAPTAAPVEPAVTPEAATSEPLRVGTEPTTEATLAPTQQPEGSTPLPAETFTESGQPLPATSGEVTNAVQEPTATEVGAHAGGNESLGGQGEGQGVGPIEQGQETPAAQEVAPVPPEQPTVAESDSTTDVRDAAMENAKLSEPESPASQTLGITPSPSAFIKQDVARVVSDGLAGFVKGFKQIRNVLSPASAGKLAETTAGIVRENAAELARKHEIAATTLRDAAKAFSKTDNQFNLDVIDKIENGKPQSTPQLDTFSQEIRKQLDARVKEVQAINPNALQHLIQDYFPHLWTKESIDELQGNPNPVPNNTWSQIFGKRPLEGPKGFLKQRSIPTTMDGVALGLEPVSWNPVELQLLKLHEMDRYVMGQKILGEMKDQGLAKFVQAGQPPEAGYVPINDKIARVLAPRDWKIVDANGKEVPGQKLLGNYYAPEDAARIINNYLSPGLKGNVAYDAFRWLGNTQNMVQLGLSLYHATFTSLDAATSAFSLGLEQIARSGFSPKEIAVGAGNVAKGLGEAGTLAGGLVENLWRGNKFLREYSRPGTTNADLANIVDAAVAGGARIRMDNFYKTGAVRSFFEALRQGNVTGAILRSPFAAIEAASKPLMEYAVPRMKAGVISQMMEYELSKLPANATRADVRVVAGRVIDSVDNRMGQMIYDNLFWNKVLKDGLMASVRSVGWNVGDLREIGGGIVDTLASPKRIVRSLQGKTEIADNPVFTKKMSYVAGLPLIVGAIGSMYQYLMTGQGPESLQDVYMPKTGRQKPDGSDERVMLPTYMKDIAPLAVAGKRGLIPLLSRAASMAQNKAHPTISTMAQMWHNQDYYGNQIRNPDDSFVQSIEKEAAFVAKQWKPFSVQGVEQREGGIKEKAQAALGIMPAPGELTRSPAMQMIHEINMTKRPAGGYTEAEQQKRADVRAAHEGEDVRPQLFKRLSKADRERVLEVATPEETDAFQSGLSRR